MAMPERLQTDVLVPLYGMEDFEASLARLNKKAQTFGLEPIRVTQHAQQRYYWQSRDTNSGGELYMVRLREGEDPPLGRAVSVVNRLSLDYPIVKLGDWSVVGQIEASGEGNLLFSVSADPADVAQMALHASCQINCEHCNAKRARKLSYLLRDGAGQYKEVGSTCLEDFTGIDPGAALFMQKMYVFWSAYGEEELGFGAGRVSSIPVRGYLARVLFCMEEDKGFVSSGTARERGILATYQRAASLDHDFRNDSSLQRRFQESYERHAEYGQRVIDWWKQHDGDDSFSHNVKILLSGEDIELKSKHLAFAAGAVPGFQRHLAKQAERQVESVHIGEVGQKRGEPLTLRSVASWDGRFGIQWRLNFSDEQGNRLSWRTSSPASEFLEPQSVGRAFFAHFKVKKHDEYKGQAVTEVSHLKVDRWLDAESSASTSVAVITIRPDTEAFVDVGLREELANILRSVGDLMDTAPGQAVDVCDINGNEVGVVSFGDPDQEVAADSVRISMRLSVTHRASEVAHCVARAILAGEDGVEGKDGQIVGAIEIGADVRGRENSAHASPSCASPGM